MERFGGTVERLCDIDVAELLVWARSIPLEDWPHYQVHGGMRPSMLNVGSATDEVVGKVMSHFPHCRDRDRLLSVVLPGHAIDPHCDDKGPEWRCRIHVPLETNPGAVTSMGGVDYHMSVGGAYKMNVRSEHAVRNDGATQRLHFMFDAIQ